MIGTYSRVRLCKDKKTDQLYAVKIFKKTQIVKEKLAIHIQKECKVLSVIDFPFLVIKSIFKFAYIVDKISWFSPDRHFLVPLARICVGWRIVHLHEEQDYSRIWGKHFLCRSSCSHVPVSPQPKYSLQVIYNTLYTLLFLIDVK